MGVTGLWTVLQPCARPIKLETLNKKRLAVDASIWIYQFLKAVRDKEGNALRNSHIVGFFRRVCKLLYIGIYPVFVFDGGAPALKRQTINNRRSRREGRREDAVRTAGKLLAIQMQRAAEEEEKKRREATRQPRNNEAQEYIPENLVYAEEILHTAQERTQNRKFRKTDQYHLPELGKSISEMGGENDPRIMSLEELEEYARHFDRGEDINVYDFSKIDFDGYFFQSLPAADRYNILNAARLRSRLRMGYSKEQLDTMFPDRMAFSRFQIERVKERNELTQRLMNLNGMNDDKFGAGVNRIASERGREYVLVKNDGVEGGWALGVVTNKDEGKEHKPIDVDVPVPPLKEEEGWEDDEFEDVPIDGLNRLPKPPPGTFINNREGKKYISTESAKRRKNVNSSRKNNATRSKPRRATPVEQDPDSLFLAEDKEGREEEWENVPTNGLDEGFQQAGDDIETQQLQEAIKLSMQQDEPNTADESDESDEDIVREVFQQKKAESINPFAAVKGSGLAIARMANQRSSKIAPRGKGPFERSDSEDDMDLQAALEESRRSKRAAKPRPTSSDSKAQSPSSLSKSIPPSTKTHVFDGPLPFEKLNLGSSILGKKKMETLEANASGGFEKSLRPEKKAEPALPPWFSGKRDINAELSAQRQDQSEQWKKAKNEEKQQFEFHELPSLGRGKPEIINVETYRSQKEPEVFTVEDEKKNTQMEDIVVEENEPTMGDLADKVRAEPPQLLNDDQRTPPNQDTALLKKAPFADESEDEQVEWSESELGEERQAKAQNGAATTQERQPSPSESHSLDFEDVPLAEPTVTTTPRKSPSPEFEDVHIGTSPTRPRSPLPLIDPQHLGDKQPSSPPPLLAEPTADSDNYSDPEDADLFASLAAEATEHARFTASLNPHINTIPTDFATELAQLRTQQKKDRRDADEVTQTMVAECQHLLSLFGLPYITAPMEAEAQCAELVRLKLVDGIVTDDSDTFLFGGTRVYKNMFNAAKFVECYLTSDLESEFNLTREHLIAVAQLLGSDYCAGIPGVGPVSALELIAEFGGLEEFRTWWDAVQSQALPAPKGRDKDKESAFRRRFRRSHLTTLFLPTTFPDPRVRAAYLIPEVDSSPEPFQWGVPDLAALREWLRAQIGWSEERTDEVLVPVVRELNRRGREGTQSNITRYFEGGTGAGAFAPRVKGATVGGPTGKNKGKGAAGRRLGKALTKLAARDGADKVEGGRVEEEDRSEGVNGNGRVGRKRKGKAPQVQADADDEEATGILDAETDEDDLYQEPEKKRSRKSRRKE